MNRNDLNQENMNQKDIDQEEKIFDVGSDEEYIDDRSRLKVFFQVLGRKFWRLMTVNLMYLLFNIPAIIILLVVAAYLTEIILPSPAGGVKNPEIITYLYMQLGLPAAFFLLAIPVICVGPAQAGMTYLLRCFSYEIPTFTWSDFKDKMKENLKQGTVICLINLFITVFFIVDFYIYSQLNVESNMVLTIASVMLLMMFIIFLMMNFYLYPMMVTYELKVKDLYKNSFLFAIAKFGPNLGVLLLCLVLILGPMIVAQLIGNVMVLFIVYLYYFVLGFTLPGLIINFCINPIIDKYLNPSSKDN